MEAAQAPTAATVGYDLSTGERIGLWRKRRHMTLADLAKAAHVSQSALSDYERGVRFPGGQAIRDIAVALDVSTDYLLGLRATASKRTSKAHPRRSRHVQAPLMAGVN